MILNLPFKKAWFYRERPVEIIIRIGTLEDVCEELKIDFWQIREYTLKNEFDFNVLLLYRAYITGCQRRYEKPKYTQVHASIWYEYMSATEKKKFVNEIVNLFGKVVKAYKTDKKKVK